MISIMDGKEKPDNQEKSGEWNPPLPERGQEKTVVGIPQDDGDSPGEDRDGDSPGENRDGDSPEGRDGDSPGWDRDGDSPEEDRDGDSPGEHCGGDSPDGDSLEDGDGVYPGEDCDGDSPKYSSLEEERDELWRHSRRGISWSESPSVVYTTVRRIGERESPEVNRWPVRSQEANHVSDLQRCHGHESDR